MTNKWNADPIQVPIGSVTRAQAKKVQENSQWTDSQYLG